MSEKSCETCDRGDRHCPYSEACGGEHSAWRPKKNEGTLSPSAKDLADAHWSYVKEVLGLHVPNDAVIGEIGFHYKSAFIHGYKHGKEDS